MKKIIELLQKGYGIGWHQFYQDFRPFSIDGDNIEWWRDPSGIEDDDFQQAVNKLHKEICK